MTNDWWRGMLLAAVLLFIGAEVTYYGQEVAKPALNTQGKQGRSSVNHPRIDSRVQITSPANGQQFAPGATVNVLVHLTTPLTANTGWISANIPGVGSLTATNYTTNSYQASFMIPPTFAGPATLTPAMIDSSLNPYLGVAITINVVPSIPPLRLGHIQPYTHLTSVPSHASL